MIINRFINSKDCLTYAKDKKSKIEKAINSFREILSDYKIMQEGTFKFSISKPSKHTIASFGIDFVCESEKGFCLFFRIIKKTNNKNLCRFHVISDMMLLNSPESLILQAKLIKKEFENYKDSLESIPLIQIPPADLLLL